LIIAVKLAEDISSFAIVKTEMIVCVPEEKECSITTIYEEAFIFAQLALT